MLSIHVQDMQRNNGNQSECVLCCVTGSLGLFTGTGSTVYTIFEFIVAVVK